MQTRSGIRSLVHSLQTFLFGVFFMAAVVAPAAITPSAADFRLSKNGVVHAVLALPDGSFLVGGSFSSINGAARTNLARLSADGTADERFYAPTNGPVYALAYDGEDAYAGGSFTNAAGNPVNNLVRLVGALSLSVDYSWRPNINGAVHALATRTDGFPNNVLYIGGAFTAVEGSDAYARLAKFTVSFRSIMLDTTWSFPANDTVRSLALGGSGVYVGGDFTTIAGVSRSRGAYVQEFGWLDSWNPWANGRISAILVTPTSLIVGGSFTQIGGTNTPYLAALNAASPISATVSAPVYALTSQGAYIYVGGSAALPQPCFRIGANAPFAQDTAYLPNLDGTVFAVAASDNALLSGGDFTKVGASVRPGLARLSLVTAAALSSTDKGAREQPTVATLLALPNGGVIVGGYFDMAGETPVKNLAKFDANAVLDPAWRPSPNSQVSSLATLGDNLYVGGYFSQIGGLNRERLAKISLLDTGATNPTWNPGTDAAPFTLHIAGDRLYVGGNFTRLGGLTRSRLGRVLLTGSGAGDSAWTMNCNASIRKIITGGDHLYVAGEFSSIGGQSRNALARINAATGALDTAWRLNLLSSGYVLALHYAPPWLYVGGGYTFRTADDLMIYGLCRVDTGATAVVDLTWRPGIDTIGEINSLSAHGDYLFVGGGFGSIGGQLGYNSAAGPYLARVHTSGRGAADPLWPGTNARVYPSAVAGNRLFVGGLFTEVGASTRSGSALFELDSPLVTSATTPYATPTAVAALTARPSGFRGGISHFRISSINNGALFRSDGVTPVPDGSFVPVSAAAAGFILVPDPGSMRTAWYEVQEATGPTHDSLVGTPATAFINLSRAAQIISFTPAGSAFYGDAPLGLTATASSGGPVSFARISGPVTLVGNMVTFTGMGEAVIEARQVGTNTHLPAPSVRQTITIRGWDYAEWSRRSFGAHAGNSAISGEAADADTDGRANLLEFAFDSNPTAPDSALGFPTCQIERVNETDRLALRFKRRRSTALPQITYDAEFSDSLAGGWAAEPDSSVSSIDPNWEMVTVIDSKALPFGGTRFGRVKVTKTQAP